MSLFQGSLIQATDTDGNPVSGAQWVFSLTGTTTPAAVYSDSALTTSLGATVTADSSGTFDPIYIDDDITYRAILKDSGGAIIRGLDIDPINPAGASAGTVSVHSFGAVGDNTTNDGPAFVAAIAYLKSIRTVPAISYGAGSGDLFVPAGRYYLGTSTLDITHTMTIRGEGTGLPGASGTSLRWAAGATGIRIQTYNTSGATGSRTPDADNASGAGSSVRNMTLIGGHSGTEGEYHGIHLRAMAAIENVSIYNFQGDGVYGRASAGGSPDGNINTSRLANVFCQGNRNGFYFDGDDSNACLISGCNAIANRAKGFDDSSFLGNTYVGCHTAANGWDGAITSTPTACTYSGNRYFVKAGQATGASTNAPTGTTADNTWWGYISAGGTYSGIVAWVSGTTFREGGGYFSDNVNATNLYVGCYSETDENPSQIAQPAMVIGGVLGSQGRNGATFMRADTGGVNFGPASGTAQDYALSLITTNVTAGVAFKTALASVLTTQGEIKTASGQLIYDHLTSHRFRLASVEKASLSSTGFAVTGAGMALGYGTGAGAAVTQITSRTTGVTINAGTGQITLVSAAGSTTETSFTVTNSVVSAGDVVLVTQKSGTDRYRLNVTATANGSFELTFRTISGTTTEQPVFNFSVIKGAAA